MENHGRRAIHAWYVGVFYSQKNRSKEDSGRCSTGKARRNTRSVAIGIPFREFLEQVGANEDLGCGAQIMWKSFIAIRDGSWEEFRNGLREKEKSSEWTLEKILEAYEKVATKGNWTFLAWCRTFLRKKY